MGGHSVDPCEVLDPLMERDAGWVSAAASPQFLHGPEFHISDHIA